MFRIVCANALAQAVPTEHLSTDSVYHQSSGSHTLDYVSSNEQALAARYAL